MPCDARRVRRRGVTFLSGRNCDFSIGRRQPADTHPEPGFPILPVRFGIDPLPSFEGVSRRPNSDTELAHASGSAAPPIVGEGPAGFT
jgi:hypothetical protein